VKVDIDVDTTVELGPLRLRNPIIAASGTFGVGDELARVCPPDALGAVTAKSLAPFAHTGNPPLRTSPAPGEGMVNSVGLAGPGIDAWIEHDLPALERTGATIIVSIWGRSVDDYAAAARAAHALGPRIAAIELNLSCPNLGGHEMFAHSETLTAAVVEATRGDHPVFAKLTAQVADPVAIARAAADAGATGLTLVNTMPALVIDTERRTPRLGAGSGGLSGPPLHAIALRTVWTVAHALPDVPIIGTGGVRNADDAVAMLLAGAHAVGVGTATFADPRAPQRIAHDLTRWCARHDVRRIRDLTGGLQWPT
jgi:dihydroorotate dehydrogenase (NAD+) catalytic subunit